MPIGSLDLEPVYTGPAVRNGLYRAKKAILCADVKALLIGNILANFDLERNDSLV